MPEEEAATGTVTVAAGRWQLDAAADKVNEQAYSGFRPQRGGIEREGSAPEPSSADGTVSFIYRP